MPYTIDKPSDDTDRLWYLYHEHTSDMLEAPNRAYLGAFNPRNSNDLLTIFREHELPFADTVLILWMVRTGKTSCDTSSELGAQLALVGTLVASLPFAAILVVSHHARKLH